MRLIQNAAFLARIKGPAAALRYLMVCNRDNIVLTIALIAIPVVIYFGG